MPRVGFSQASESEIVPCLTSRALTEHELRLVQEVFLAAEDPTFTSVELLLMQLNLQMTPEVVAKLRQLLRKRNSDNNARMTLPEFIELAQVSVSSMEDPARADLIDAYEAFRSNVNPAMSPKYPTEPATFASSARLGQDSSFREFERFFETEVEQDPAIARLFVRMGAKKTQLGLLLDSDTLNARCLQVGLDPSEAQLILNIFDEDVSGEIDFEEFKSVLFTQRDHPVPPTVIRCMTAILGMDEDDLDALFGKYGESSSSSPPTPKQLMNHSFSIRHMVGAHVRNRKSVARPKSIADYSLEMAYFQMQQNLAGMSEAINRSEGRFQTRPVEEHVITEDRRWKGLPPIDDFRRQRYLSKKVPMLKLKPPPFEARHPQFRRQRHDALPLTPRAPRPPCHTADMSFGPVTARAAVTGESLPPIISSIAKTSAHYPPATARLLSDIDDRVMVLEHRERSRRPLLKMTERRVEIENQYLSLIAA